MVTALGLHRCHALGHSRAGTLSVDGRGETTGDVSVDLRVRTDICAFVSRRAWVGRVRTRRLMASTAYMVKSARPSGWVSVLKAAEALAAYQSKMPTKAWHKDALDAYVNNGGFIPAEDGDGVRLACSTETEIGIYEAGNARNRGVRSTGKNSVSSRHRQRHVRRPRTVAHPYTPPSSRRPSPPPSPRARSSSSRTTVTWVRWRSLERSRPRRANSSPTPPRRQSFHRNYRFKSFFPRSHSL